MSRTANGPTGRAREEVSMPRPLSISAFFQDLPDPRRECLNKKHELIDILVIALCGVIAGC
jgi:hypothetical protein